ncbi:hypothetical protein [Candidatus Chloroploca sp. Khr17]|uniref:DUF6978 family protein n=1 Tax=Candidatus Chloroploca sp. Khr17 TaxID=2496869 RepID=UPI00101C3167|nr:hypothetical protein [Candidatus Chloroploca sp. Khr17]
MAEINLSQVEADELMAMEKHRADENCYYYPGPRTSLVVPLISADKREAFLLDANRRSININRYTYMNRVRTVVILARLDVEGPPHRNPDGIELPTPHLHLYREGFNDKWAYSIPTDKFSNVTNPWLTLEEFMRFCNITLPPYIERGMFV